MRRRQETAGVAAGVAVAVAAGLVAGWFVSRRFDHRHRSDLFSTRAYRRRAALGWLARERNPERLPLLHDYLAWEEVPALRARAWKLVGALRMGAGAGAA